MTARRPVMTRLLAALLVLGGIGLFILALCTPRPRLQPLRSAQLAGSRSIVLEEGHAVYGFDADRPPIVVVPPTESRWRARAVGLGASRGLALVAEPADDRVRLRLSGPLPIGRWTLVVEDDTRQATWPARFSAVPAAPEAIVALKAQAEAAPVEGRPAVWRGALAGLAGRERIAARVEEARAWIAAGDLAQAAKAYTAAARDAGAIGWVSEQAGRLRAAAWALYRLRRFEAALDRLEEANRLTADLDDAVGQARVLYLRGCIQNEVGLYRDAMDSLKRSCQAATRFQDGRLEHICQNELATLLSNLGQHEAALELLTQTPTARAERGRRLTTRGWIAARLAGRRPAVADDARRDLEAALRFLENPDVRHSATLNLIDFELAQGRFDAARRWLASLDEDARFGRIDLALARGQIAAQAGVGAEAEGYFQAIRRDPQANEEQRWRADLGLALLAAAEGKLERAAQLTDRALATLRRLSRGAALDAGRASMLDDRRRLARTAIEVRLAQGDAAGALAVLDATRTWVLGDLEARLRIERLDGAARRRWFERQARYQRLREEITTEAARCDALPADERRRCAARLSGHRRQVEAALDAMYAVLDEAAPSALTDRLPTLPDGAALFTSAQIGDRLLGFWLDPAGAVVEPVTRAAPLAPFAARVAQARHLYVVPGAVSINAVLDGATGQATALRERITWSEVPFAGLLAQPYISAGGPPVVIADPTADLQHARAEGKAVHQRIGGRLLVGEAVTREAALTAFGAGAAVVHFAGHGALDAESPWQAHLALADGERLTLADLLVAQPKVGVVLLSGCETGVRSALSDAYRVGLPDAFLLAGARAVIATDRVVPDADARAFIDQFYQSPDWAQRPAAAFARAVRAMRAAGNPIWSAFRFMGRA